jgi:inosine triphosphate pyrophosphatase
VGADSPHFPTPLVLVTGNPGKLAEAQRLSTIELEAIGVELPEIQSLDIREVLRAKARAAYQRIGRPVIVDETALELAAFNGFPGVLVKWMLQAIGAEGIGQTAESLGDSRATARCALLLYTPSAEIYAEGTTCGRLVVPPRGDEGFGWDPVFQPEGLQRTFAELSGPEKDRISHRGRAWRLLESRLRSRSRP